jgi:hypothetical protein
MQLTDDQYVIQLGNYLRIRSRSKAAEDMGRGRAQKDIVDPDWRKRCHVSPEWSVEDRKELSEKVKAAWARPEMAEKREAARQRLLAWRNTHTQSDHARDVTSQRMLMGGSRDAVAARKIMRPEKIAERKERDAAMAEAYYVRGMRVEDIAKLYGLEISYAYAIIRKTPI